MFITGGRILSIGPHRQFRGVSLPQGSHPTSFQQQRDAIRQFSPDPSHREGSQYVTVSYQEHVADRRFALGFADGVVVKPCAEILDQSI